MPLTSVKKSDIAAWLRSMADHPFCVKSTFFMGGEWNVICMASAPSRCVAQTSVRLAYGCRFIMYLRSGVLRV